MVGLQDKDFWGKIPVHVFPMIAAIIIFLLADDFRGYAYGFLIYIIGSASAIVHMKRLEVKK